MHQQYGPSILLTVASILTLILATESVSPTTMLSENSYPARKCQGIPNTGITAGYDISKPNVSTVAACIAACEAIATCCIAQFNPAHERAKCDLKSYGTLRPRPAENVTAITCVPKCPQTPPQPHPPSQKMKHHRSFKHATRWRDAMFVG